MFDLATEAQGRRKGRRVIDQIVERGFCASERKLGESVDYLRDIYRASPSAVIKLALFLPLSEHRATAPPEAYHVARLAAVMNEDCGPCLRIAIKFARRAGVSRDLIHATLAGDVEAMSEPLAEVCRFAEAVVKGDPATAELAAKLTDIHGRDALVDLALGIATARVFPTLRRALGHGASCTITAIDV
jgi:hypothetical protein